MQQKMPWISPTRLHALFLARARYCITPHRNFDRALPVLPVLPVFEATGLDGSTTGRLALAAWVSRGGPHQKVVPGSMPCYAVPPYSLCLVFGSGPSLWLSGSSSRDGASIHHPLPPS